MLTAILLGIVAFAQLVIGLGVFIGSSNRKDTARRLFAALSASVFLWVVATTALSFVDSAGNRSNLMFFQFANVIGYAFATLTMLFMFNFSSYYPYRIAKSLLYWFINGLGLTVLMLTPLELLAGRFSLVDTQLVYEAGSLTILYAVLGLAILASIYKNSVHSIAVVKDQNTKKQIKVLVAGLTLCIIHALLFLIILPVFYSDSAIFYAVGYLAPYYFMSATIYSLFRQGLFDIRFVVARSVAYILLLVTSALIFATVVIAIPAGLIGYEELGIGQRIYYTVAAVVLAFAFQPLRRFFDKLTNVLFYRDAYDPQQFIGQLNKNLVTTVDIDSLLTNSIDIIEENLKSQFCIFGIRETSYVPRRIVGKKDKPFNEEDIETVRDLTSHIHQKVIVTDYLEESDKELSEILRHNDVAVLVRLTTAVELDIEGIGYIVLGAKKSGNPYNKQDIQTLNIIANELVIAIQNALRFEEIEKFNITLQEKVDDATKRLRRTNDKLKALDETKDEFISMASHQLRTPLTSVKGYLSMVLEGDAGNVSEMQRKLLDQAFVSSQRMVYLIADLLNVSRLRTGKFIIEPVVSKLADVVEGEVGQLKETAAGRGLKLTYEKPADFPELNLDETKIRQVIMNFTDNAIYYTPKGGQIKVKLEDKGESIEFTVNDDGMGVPKSEQPHLFTKFYRAGNAKKARPDGTGLGLFMAKKVIVAQGGSIIFHSQEGKGSTFGFSFPKDKLTPQSVKDEG